MIVYDKLWETMKEKGISQYKLIHDYGISPAQITRLKRNSNVNTNTLDILCEILDCQLIEIAEHIPNASGIRAATYAEQLAPIIKIDKPQ